ncbi:MAG: hypothetical protein DME32_03665 [Verrucomicrobia bacterium]|nr:MAG: hypothetical protein DME32_03665 [Verrucomicrobiota bacterium]
MASSVVNGKSPVASHLPLSSSPWHGHCNSGPEHNLFFESKADANCISRERKEKMKPTVEQNNLSKRGDGAQKNGATFPFVDSNYHAVALPNYRGGCLHAKSLSFRSISGEYFRHEARNEFCVEALAFFAMVVTAAIPILNNMHALADFLRVIGRF